MPTSLSTEAVASGVRTTTQGEVDAQRGMFEASIAHLGLDVPADMRDELFTHWRYFVQAGERMRQAGLAASDEPSHRFDPLEFAGPDHAG